MEASLGHREKQQGAPMLSELGLMLVALLLVLLNGFFVLAEFAIVKVRATRLEELSERGVEEARIAREIISRLDAYLSSPRSGSPWPALRLVGSGSRPLPPCSSGSSISPGGSPPPPPMALRSRSPSSSSPSFTCSSENLPPSRSPSSTRKPRRCSAPGPYVFSTDCSRYPSSS